MNAKIVRCIPAMIVLCCVLTSTALASTPQFPSRIQDIQSGNDGTIWYSLPDVSAIGFQLSNGCTYLLNTGRGRPERLYTDNSGRLWFTQPLEFQVGTIDNHRRRYFSVKSLGEQPWQILAAPRGNVWIVPVFGKQLIRMDSSGQLSGVSITSKASLMRGATALTDGSIAVSVDKSVEFLDAESGRLTSSVKLNSHADRLTAVGNDVWYLDEDRELGVISQGRSSALLQLPVDTRAGGLLAVPGHLYIGGTGKIYDFNIQTKALQSEVLPQNGIVSALRNIDNRLWAGSQNGELAYASSSGWHSVNLRKMLEGALYICGSLVPNSWL